MSLLFTTVCVEELMEVLQEQLDFQGTRTVQLIIPEPEQHVNLKIKASNVLSTTRSYKQSTQRTEKKSLKETSTPHRHCQSLNDDTLE